MSGEAGRISLERIEEAASVIDPVFLNSPEIAFAPHEHPLGADLTLKVETLNPVRCFKGRGGDFVVRQRAGSGPLVVASAGNFGQGIAYAARSLGIPLTIYAAETANTLKIERMRDLGAEVILEGRDFDAAKDAARAHAERHGQHFIEDGQDPAVSEGAGTMALELLRGDARYDALLVPLGNGAMINGIGTWVKHRSPETQVIGVCATGAPSMERSWRSGRVETTKEAATIADGIAVRVPVPEALDDMNGIVDDVLLVDDSVTLEAMRLILLHAGLLAEPSGAIGLAALMAHKARFEGQRLAAPLCGGNVTREQFQAWFT